MKLSIITVCRNSEKTIRRTIESVLNQSCSAYEYILIDGASTDGTVNIIEEYKQKYPDIVKYVSEPDKGIYDAMNKGIKMATGDMIGIINSDDWYEPGAFQIVADAYKSEIKYQIIYGCVRLCDEDISKQICMTYFDAVKQFPMMHPAMFISKSVYTRYGSYNQKYKYVADWDYFIKLSNYEDIVTTPIEKILTNFSCGGASETFAAKEEMLVMKYKRGMIGRKGLYLALGLNKLRQISRA